MPNYKYSPNDCQSTLTIPESSDTSDTVDLFATRMVGIVTPSAMTGTAVNVLASFDGVTFYPYYNKDGVEVEIDIATNRWIGIVPADFAGIRYIKLVSNATEAAERLITIVTRPL